MEEGDLDEMQIVLQRQEETYNFSAVLTHVVVGGGYEARIAWSECKYGV